LQTSEIAVHVNHKKTRLRDPYYFNWVWIFDLFLPKLGHMTAGAY